MKAVNLLLAVMFLVFAFLQLNDPDPLIWILVYGSMAVVCVMAAFRNYKRWFMVALLVIFIAYSFVFLGGVMEWFRQPDRSVLFNDIAKMEHPYIEESREFLGLMICILVLLIHLGLSIRSSKTAPN